MIRLIRIWIHRASIKASESMLLKAEPEARAELLREIAVSKLRLSQLEG
ncbi:hypothetical protein [Herbaspirillum aquaticum]|nr:hypothetical protein [Herbaspirillum aquaticum]